MTVLFPILPAGAAYMLLRLILFDLSRGGHIEHDCWVEAVVMTWGVPIEYHHAFRPLVRVLELVEFINEVVIVVIVVQCCA